MPAMPMADPRRGVAQEILIAYPAACAELIPVKVYLCSRRKALLWSEAFLPYGRRVLHPVVLKGV